MAESTRTNRPSKNGASRSGKSRASIQHVDPARNRPANAEESVPEALVPDVVRVNLDSQQGSDEGGSAERAARIARRAYELAQQRGFHPGAEISDWLQAEAEIDAAPVRQTPPEDQFTG